MYFQIFFDEMYFKIQTKQYKILLARNYIKKDTLSQKLYFQILVLT